MMSQCSGIPIKYFDTKFGYSRINEMLLNIIVSVYFRMGKLNDASFFSFKKNYTRSAFRSSPKGHCARRATH